MKYTLIGKSKINTNFYDFVNDEVLPDTGLDKSDFWQNFISAANELIPENNALINETVNAPEEPKPVPYGMSARVVISI